MSGRAWKLGDDISTDHITPGRYFHLRSRIDELSEYALVDVRPEFAREVQAGDFVVAGANMGIGSSREHAPLVLKVKGVRAVLAKSFARIFFRNCINLGLPAIACDTDAIEDGDELALDLERGVVVNRTRSIEIEFPPFPDMVREILDAGGLIEYLKLKKPGPA